MRLTTLAVATALVLATASVATAAATFENHGGRGNQFVHGAFGPGPVHRRHHHNTFVLPYGYYDYDYPADAFGEPPTDPPPVVSSVPPHRLHANAAWRNLPSLQKTGAVRKSRS